MSIVGTAEKNLDVHLARDHGFFLFEVKDLDDDLLKRVHDQAHQFGEFGRAARHDHPASASGQGQLRSAI